MKQSVLQGRVREHLRKGHDQCARGVQRLGNLGLARTAAARMPRSSSRMPPLPPRSRIAALGSAARSDWSAPPRPLPPPSARSPLSERPASSSLPAPSAGLVAPGKNTRRECSTRCG